MHSWSICIFLLSIAFFASSAELPEEVRELLGFERRHVAMGTRQVAKERKGAFDCKEKGAACGGVISCCGTLQCYWRDGYSALKDGQCVDCVSKGLKCQRDSQCCGGLICHKANGFHVDGDCGDPRSKGAECHDNDQCQSGKCDIGYWANLKGQGGKCT